MTLSKVANLATDNNRLLYIMTPVVDCLPMMKTMHFQVYFNTLRNWVLLDVDKCIVKPILFITNASGVEFDVLIEFAQQLGWEIFQAPKLSRSGLPFVKDMYLNAAERVPNCSYYAYSNGDILFSRGLIDTLQAVSQVWLMM